MTSRCHSKSPRAVRRSTPPAFMPVKLRKRQDGWSVELQCAFLAQLYCQGSVAAAARAVGKSRASAYKLRARKGAEGFARAWDKVLAPVRKARSNPSSKAAPGPATPRRRTDWRKLTLRDLHWRVETGFVRPVIYRGKVCKILRKPDNSALLRLLRRYDAATRRIERSGKKASCANF